MANDFKNMVNTAPLLITSQWVPAFRSYQDSQNDVDQIPLTVDPVGAPPPPYTVPTPPVSAGNVMHYRNHCLSTIAFCCRDLYQRQTGGSAGTFLSPSSSYEAYVWYGHVSQNTPGNGYQYPGGIGNLYASQWALGRVAMLFQQSTTLAYVPQLKYSKTADSVNIQGYTPQMSRFDVVSGPNEGTIDAFTAYIYANDGAANWWGGAASSNLTNPAFLNYRFQCDPKPGRPLIPDTAAFYAPAFVAGCSQFCVEFAGDFVSQNPNGTPNTSATPGPDGTIDFRIVNGTRQIIWYGMPRSVSGDGQVLASWNSNPPRPDVDTVQNTWKGAGVLPPVTANSPGYTFERMPAGNTATYVAAWHPKDTNNPRPKLIRIIWAVEDPNNRLGLPVTFEYVFPVP